ncbi:TIGR03759 family integrating conjugative element protein [Kushneria indalinina]|uniref:Integrating conjugative element protein (TIGR03759 family) n=1 Tax=Kushneria indalinina DSM 14324 TaxID=1122140 RepID=A0A3D9DRM6_9GAMM|nr:TIGR03759 family integrating conjugative element protein [Kushneria indalinina]REC93352.1 integrating conjugative element protein (TIGR03759 family) [Kushneria indalinina DSM 14324]
MTMNRTPGLGIMVTLLLAAPAWGQESQTTRVDQTQVEQSSQRAAEAWGLNRQEYDRYESIMEGPRGKWSPNLDPLTALGLEARSDAERQKYAEKLVETERARVEGELAFQRAYDAAWKRLYPNDMPVESFSTKGGEDATQSVFGSNPAASDQRLTVVVATEGCDQCVARVKQLMNNGASMDIFVMDAEGNDDLIRRWATKVGIPPSKVRDRVITLNHGGSRDLPRTDLPRVVRN